MSYFYLLSYIATGLVLSAVYYISILRLRGQYLIVAADCSWLLYSLTTKQYALSLQSIILLIIGLSAIRNWKRQNIQF